MSPRSFQRARRPEQIAERRTQILEVAQALLEEDLDTRALSLNELARRCGMAKSNLYRYFESREAILLEILGRESASWAEELIAGLPAAARTQDPLRSWTRRLARSAARRPRMCQLASVLPSVLEHNVSAETVLAFKSGSLELLRALAGAAHTAIPALSAEQHFELVKHGFVALVGLWPLAHPAPAVAEVLQAPALAPFRHDFEQDYARMLLLMARGLESQGP